MEDKEALPYLIKLLENASLTAEEKEAVKTAIGVLSWTTLRKGMLKSLVINKKLRKERLSHRE
jgi:hypothetical protein